MAMAPKETYTIEQFIDAGTGVTITYHNLSYLEKLVNNLECPIFNVVDDYLKELISFSMVVEFNDEEFDKYKYKPKLLCNDIYGNAELYFIVLLINDMCDVKDFSKRKIKLIPKTNMESAISYIYNAERILIEEYNS